MKRAKELRKRLGERYSFKRWVSGQELFRLQKCPPEDFIDQLLAVLEVGCVKMEVVAFKDGESVRIGYDVFVKDSLEAKEWICYDVSNCAVRLKEADMLLKLDEIVEGNGLSYTECCFEKVDGIEVATDKKLAERPP